MKVRMLTVSTASTSNYKEAPAIRIQGKWLRDLGFKTGCKVIVEENHGLLTIRLIKIDEE